MDKSVILEQRKLFSALGELDHTVQYALDGRSAIQPGPSFGSPAAYASFPIAQLYDFDITFENLFKEIDLTGVILSSTILIYCSAKGDLRSFDELPGETGGYIRTLLDTQARIVASIAGITPARISVVSCACASGAVAVELAKELLERKLFTHALIAGFDVQSQFITSGFFALNALSPEGARPFDAKRDGLTLGDGAAVAVLSFRKASPGDIIVAGAGTANDANHRTGPSRTGDGLYRAASAAVKDSGIPIDKIGAVKCHGTATVYNDAMEAKAITRLFGQKIPPCFSMKGAIGHTSGTGSLLELLCASEFLKRRTVPPTAGYEKHGVDEPLAISAEAQKMTANSILCLSAGFGGINAAVVLRECA